MYSSDVSLTLSVGSGVSALDAASGPVGVLEADTKPAFSKELNRFVMAPGGGIDDVDADEDGRLAGSGAGCCSDLETKEAWAYD